MVKKISNEHFMALLCIALITISIGYLALSRTYMTFATETDYIGGFIPEAQRIIAGQPLSLDFHPPLYSIILAAVQTQTNNWLLSGVIISLASCVLVLISNYYLFYHICGRNAAWGTLLVFMASAIFVTFSCFATSDIFFLAIYSCVLLLIYLSVTVYTNKWLWVFCGIMCSVGLLTRSNGLSLLAILVVPWISAYPISQRLKNFLLLIAGISIPIFAWITFAVATGSPLTPSGNHTNLALTYFSGTSDRMSGDARVQIEDRFHNLIEVLTYNPTLMVKTYLKDFYLLLKKFFTSDQLILYPLNLLVILGFILLIEKTSKYFAVYLILFALPQMLLVNFKAYEDRYYLFLVPLMGAAVGTAFEKIVKISEWRPVRIVVIFFLIIISVIGVKASFIESKADLNRENYELKEVISNIKKLDKSKYKNANIVTRKPHLAFYLDMNQIFFPQTKTLAELKAFLDTEVTKRPLYVYFGTAENNMRKQYSILLRPSEAPEWLELIAISKKKDFWALYKYHPHSGLAHN